MVTGTQSNMYDGAFLCKQLPTFSRYLFLREKKSFIKDVQLVSKLASKKFLINTFSITVILDIFAEVIIQCEEWKCQNRVLFKFTFIVRFQNLTIKIIRILLKIIRKSLEIY